MLDTFAYYIQFGLFVIFIIIIPSIMTATAVISIILYLTDAVGLTQTGIHW